MFYLGGMTLGYLTPHVPTECNTMATAPASAKLPPSQGKLQASRYDAAKDRPILWPWHLFH